MKKIILFVALPLPVLVFIFLKMFGKNEFEIPVYWSEGVQRNIPACNPYPTPYILPDSALNAWGWKGEKATLIILDDRSIKDNLSHVADLFDKGDYATLLLSNAPYEVKTCLLLAGDSSKVIMIDDKKQIRGYYTPTTRKETDRLGVELRILLKQY